MKYKLNLDRNAPLKIGDLVYLWNNPGSYYCFASMHEDGKWHRCKNQHSDGSTVYIQLPAGNHLVILAGEINQEQLSVVLTPEGHMIAVHARYIMPIVF